MSQQQQAITAYQLLRQCYAKLGQITVLMSEFTNLYNEAYGLLGVERALVATPQVFQADPTQHVTGIAPPPSQSEGGIGFESAQWKQIDGSGRTVYTGNLTIEGLGKFRTRLYAADANSDGRVLNGYLLPNNNENDGKSLKESSIGGIFVRQKVDGNGTPFYSASVALNDSPVFNAGSIPDVVVEVVNKSGGSNLPDLKFKGVVPASLFKPAAMSIIQSAGASTQPSMQQEQPQPQAYTMPPAAVANAAPTPNPPSALPSLVDGLSFPNPQANEPGNNVLNGGVLDVQSLLN
jgi:hypothetical protein